MKKPAALVVASCSLAIAQSSIPAGSPAYEVALAVLDEVEGIVVPCRDYLPGNLRPVFRRETKLCAHTASFIDTEGFRSYAGFALDTLEAEGVVTSDDVWSLTAYDYLARTYDVSGDSLTIFFGENARVPTGDENNTVVFLLTD